MTLNDGHEIEFLIYDNNNVIRIYYQVATFLYLSDEYMMRPEHCFYDIGRDMKFKLAKIKRTHLLHSQPLKTGKINHIHY